MVTQEKSEYTFAEGRPKLARTTVTKIPYRWNGRDFVKGSEETTAISPAPSQ